MAAVVLSEKIAASPLAGRVEVVSSGTGNWHVGERMDSRAASTLAAAGYDPDQHRAQQFDRRWFARHDLVLVMDGGNLRDVRGLASDADLDRIALFREFDPEADVDLDVPDPWYGGQSGFDHVLAIVERTTDGIVSDLEQLLG
jgi:protein-tyrosine phosphatase